MIFTLTNVVASFNFLGKKRIYTAFSLCVNRGVKGKIAGENRVLSLGIVANLLLFTSSSFPASMSTGHRPIYIGKGKGGRSG